MSVINVLDFKTANLIAAGEVVERPASVVKELVENSIDAGARRVTVEIRGGGISMIRVTDDGCGMSDEDLKLCVLRHATSKIATGDDLAAISTLGFRGEALAATAAVSRMKIVSKRREDDVAHSITVSYGVSSRVTETGAPDGTTVTVSELFSNVPARRKFLKADRTEAAAVSSVCEKLALSSPDVSFTFISDGAARFSTSGDGSLKNAVYAIFGRQFAAEMLPVDASSEGITVKGAVCSPVAARSNRAMELFFINGRYVRSGVISQALEQALLSFIPTEKFPAAFLFITLHPSSVDVNVHPSKQEVKFSSDRPVFDAVYYAVKASTVRGQRPEYPIPEERKKTVSPFVPVTDEYTKETHTQLTAFDGTHAAQPEIKRFVPPEPEIGISAAPASAVRSPSYTELYKTYEIKEDKPSDQSAPAKAEEDAPKGYRYIGEAFDTYLFVEQGDDVLIIDKHAAHERLRFERLKAEMYGSARSYQVRMVPIAVNLTREESDAAEKYREELYRAGYGYEITEHGANITQCPAGIADDRAKELFVEMLAQLVETGADPTIPENALFEKALYQVSCKGAVKGGDKNDEEALIALVDELFSHPDVTYCPHGRPVAFRMTKAAIEHRFGRT